MVELNYLNQYEKFLTFQKGYSKNTISSYISDIAIFIEFLKKEDLKLKDVTYDNVKQFLTEETLDNISKRSNSRRIVALRGFYNYLVKYHKFEKNPFIGVSLPKLDKNLPDYFYDEEIEMIFQKNSKRDDLLAKRDQALLELLFFSGLRVSEVVSLIYDDIDFEKRIMRIRGKGDKERLVPFTERCKSSLIEYTETLRKELLANNEIEYLPFVFINSRGKQLTSRGIEYILKSIESKLGLKMSLHPHKFRHSFATHLLNQGMSLRSIQILMGHSSLSSTQVYTHVSDKKIEEEYHKTFRRNDKQ